MPFSVKYNKNRREVSAGKQLREKHVIVKGRDRLVEFDLVDKFSGRLPSIVVQIVFGLFCFLIAVFSRALVDTFFAAAGPFSLIYPAILVSTLYGRWLSGLTTFLLAFVHAWYAVLPEPNSFSFAVEGDAARTIVNGCAAFFILILAELFRRGIHLATAERDRQLATTKLLIRELEHRTKNNFAMVSALLNMQSRNHTSSKVKDALEMASSRVNSFAAIHDSIYRSGDFQKEIDIAEYLEALCESLQKAFSSNSNINITLSATSCRMERDKAVALGLILNEVVTNAVKHAFPDNRTGIIQISFLAPTAQPWSLTISDNGCGMEGEAAKKPAGKDKKKGGGLGTRLMNTFAQNADAEIDVKTSREGTIFTLAERCGSSTD